jgi:2,5-diketo-D-gluconate reductase A
LNQFKKGPFGVSILEDEVVLAVAKETGRTPVQVVLKFLLQLSPAVNVIPKSVTPERIKENIQLDFTLNESQFARLKARNRASRIVNNGMTNFKIDYLSLGL